MKAEAIEFAAFWEAVYAPIMNYMKIAKAPN